MRLPSKRLAAEARAAAGGGDADPEPSAVGDADAGEGWTKASGGPSHMNNFLPDVPVWPPAGSIGQNPTLGSMGISPGRFGMYGKSIDMVDMCSHLMSGELRKGNEGSPLVPLLALLQQRV